MSIFDQETNFIDPLCIGQKINFLLDLVVGALDPEKVELRESFQLRKLKQRFFVKDCS
jgi:hypothetical protein